MCMCGVSGCGEYMCACVCCVLEESRNRKDIEEDHNYPKIGSSTQHEHQEIIQENAILYEHIVSTVGMCLKVANGPVCRVAYVTFSA